MTRHELAQILAYIATAIGKPLSPEACEVYFDLLGDLPADILRLAAKKVVLQHKWATLPTVAELREAAAEIMHGEIHELSWAEAWEMAWEAIKRIDPDIEGSIQRGCEGLPPIVVRTMETFGIRAMCYGREPLTVVKAQFRDIFEQLQSKARAKALLPEALRKAIASIGEMPPDEPKRLN